MLYRWFCRLSIEDKVPDHSSLTRIRDRMGEETFKKIFERLVRFCIEKKIITATKVMMDGSLIKADAALNSLVEKDEAGQPASKERPKYIKGSRYSNETHVSFSDPECTLAGKVGEPKQLRYKVHTSIDRESRIIIDPHVTTGADVEGKTCMGRLDHIEKTFGVKVDQLTGDRGYGYGINLHQLEERGTTSFIPNFHQDVGDNIDLELFKFNAERDMFTCPVGFPMERRTSDKAESENYMRRYQVKGANCAQCPMNTKCFATPPQPGTRKMLSRNIYWQVQARVKKREADPDVQKVRGERQWKAEGIFAEGKNHHGLGRARYRGRAKMQIQAYMISFVQNLKRLVELCPEFSVLVLVFAERILEKVAGKKYFSEKSATVFLSAAKVA